MPRGERGSAKPYLRRDIWWIRYSVPGDGKERRESSKSTNKADAVRLLHQRLKQIDDRQIATSKATIHDLLELFLADQLRQGRRSCRTAEGYVRVHLDPAFGKIPAEAFTTRMPAGLRLSGAGSSWGAWRSRRWSIWSHISGC